MNPHFTAQVTQLLQTTFTASDSAERKRAEEQLLSLQNEVQTYFDTLLSIIVSGSNEVSPQVQNSAAIHLRKFIREKSDSGALSEETKEALGKHLFRVLVAEGIDLPVKASLGYALTPLLNVDSELPSSRVVLALHPEIVACLQGTHASVIGACKTIKAIFSGFSTNPTLFPLFKHLEDSLLLACRNALQGLAAATDPMLAMPQVDALFELCNTITSIIEFFDITEKPRLKEFKDHYALAEIYSSVLSLNLTDPTLHTASVICVTNQPVYSRLNLAKAQVLQGVNLVLEYLSENRKSLLEEEGKTLETQLGIDMPESPIANSFYTLLEPMTQSLHFLVCMNDFDEAMQADFVTELVLEVFLVMQKLVKENKFSSFFNTHYRAFIVEICLVFMRASSKDLEELDETPEEFVNKSVELCERHESEHVKTAVCQFFESLCDYIDGAAAFATHFCRELVEFALLQQNVGFSHLGQFPAAQVINAPPHILAETGLLGLSVIAPTVSRRKDLIEVLEHFIKQHWDLLSAVTSQLVQQRLCMFIHYFAEKLFVMDTEWMSKLTKLVILYNAPSPDAIAKNMQAAITVNYFFTEEEIAYRLDEILPSIFSDLVGLIPLQTNVQFFDAMQEIISANFGLALEYLQPLVSNLAEQIRVLATQSLENEKKRKKLTIFIIKNWNMIRYIGAHKELSPEQITCIEETLLPVFEFIQNPAAIDFDDDILLFEVSLIRKCQGVTQAGWTIFHQLSKVQDKYEGTLLQLFPIMNCYLHFGREMFVSNVGMLGTVVEMCSKCLFAVYRSKPNEAANSEGALILQQLLHTYVGVADSLLERILGSVLQRLFQQIKNGFFRIRLLGVLFSALCYNASKTVEILSAQTLQTGTCLDFCVQQLLEVAGIVSHAHDRKVLSLGLIQLIKTMPFSELTCTLFQVLIQILSTYENPAGVPNLSKLEAQLKQLSREGLQLTNGTLKASTLTQMNKKLGSEEIEAELALSTFLTPLNDQDEFDHFRQFIQSVQTETPHILKQMVSYLNKTQFTQLSNIIKSRKVVVPAADHTITEVRRPVKPKRRLT